MELLAQWLAAGHGRRSHMAEQLRVPRSFVTKMAKGDKPVPIAHGAEIERITGGEVSRRDMFPNDWYRIWPELAISDQKQPSALDMQSLQATKKVAQPTRKAA